MFKHEIQWGPIGLHMVCPKPTNIWLTSRQSSLGNHDSNSLRVSSGVLVVFFNHPNLLLILCTWVSTPVNYNINIILINTNIIIIIIIFYQFQLFRSRHSSYKDEPSWGLHRATRIGLLLFLVCHIYMCPLIYEKYVWCTQLFSNV